MMSRPAEPNLGMAGSRPSPEVEEDCRCASQLPEGGRARLHNSGQGTNPRAGGARRLAGRETRSYRSYAQPL